MQLFEHDDFEIATRRVDRNAVAPAPPEGARPRARDDETGVGVGAGEAADVGVDAGRELGDEGKPAAEQAIEEEQASVPGEEPASGGAGADTGGGGPLALLTPSHQPLTGGDNVEGGGSGEGVAGQEGGSSGDADGERATGNGSLVDEDVGTGAAGWGAGWGLDAVDAAMEAETEAAAGGEARGDVRERGGEGQGGVEGVDVSGDAGGSMAELVGGEEVDAREGAYEERAGEKAVEAVQEVLAAVREVIALSPKTSPSCQAAEQGTLPGTQKGVPPPLAMRALEDGGGKDDAQGGALKEGAQVPMKEMEEKLELSRLACAAAEERAQQLEKMVDKSKRVMEVRGRGVR